MGPTSGKGALAALLLSVGCGSEQVGTATSELAPSPIYLRPTDDATVVSLTHANTNYGGDPTLQVDSVDSQGGVERSYLQFTVGNVAGRLGRARLRLEVLASSATPVDVYSIPGTSWNEDTITWQSRPGVSGLPLVQIPGTTVGQLVYTDVTRAVAPNRTITFALVPRPGGDNADFASKEHPTARRPSLILDNISACTAPTSEPTALAACNPDLLTGTAGNVSGELVHHPDVTVTQLTDSVDQWNMISYYDIPAVVAGSDRFVYTRVKANSYAATMTLAGGDPRVITNSPESGKNTFLTPNGAMAYFPRRNTSTNRMEIKAVDLDGSACAESTIAQGLPLPPTGSVTQLSTASRICSSDEWVLAVATREWVYRFKGKKAAGGPWAPMGSFLLSDELSHQKFHRLRLSPTCPNILMYSRDRADGAGDKDIYVADLDRHGEAPYFLAFGETAREAALTHGIRTIPSHEMWSNDGLRVSYTQAVPPEDSMPPDGGDPNIPPRRKLMIGNIVNSDCTLRTTNPEGDSNLEGTSGIASRTFKGTVIDHQGDPDDPDYPEPYFPKFCSWSSDDELFACSGYKLVENDSGEFVEGESAIFLLNPKTFKTRFLTKTHELAGEKPYEGQSHLQFAGDKMTILFDSDRLAGARRLPGQVYKLTYPSSMLPAP